MNTYALPGFPQLVHMQCSLRCKLILNDFPISARTSNRAESKAACNMLRGTYRASPGKWFHPEKCVPAGSTLDAASGSIRSPMQREGDAWRLQLRVPAELAPLTLAYQVCE